MARGDITGAQLRQQYIRTLNAFDDAVRAAGVDIARKAVAYQGKQAMKRAVVNVYSTSIAQLWALSMQQTFADLEESTANALLKGAQAIQRATIGETEAQQRDNEEIEVLMSQFADRINEEILEQYLQEFSGRSYRESDPARRSGGIERFLRKGTVAHAEGHNVEVSLRSAVADDDVPHIFRLNYGTKSLTGAEKGGTRPPNFTISMVPGASGSSRVLSGSRRPGFYFPGGRFTYRLAMGGAGQIQLYRSSDFNNQNRIGGGTRPRPSQGIAPSYFVEYGLTEAAKQFPQEMKQLIDRWRRRVAQISGDVSNLK